MRRPFPGLEPYGEDNAAYFFGRQDERRLIRDYLFSSGLTILHGEAGVGKSSLVRAGVACDLREEAKWNKKEYGVPKLTVTVFPSLAKIWAADPEGDLMHHISDDVAQIDPAMRGSFAESFTVEALDQLTQKLGGKTGRGIVFIILDQFDEYMNLIMGQDGRIANSAFIRCIGSMLRCPGLGVNVVFCIRSDSLSKLENFEEVIPNILTNHLHIEPLNARSAQEVIAEPIKLYNRERCPVEPEAHIDEGLVRAIIGEVGTIIQPPYLQIVMTSLWNRAISEVDGGHSAILNEALLERCGGAEALLRQHVRTRLSELSTEDLRIAQHVLPYLVTRSSLRPIPHTPQDLSIGANIIAPEIATQIAVLLSSRYFAVPLSFEAKEEAEEAREHLRSVLCAFSLLPSCRRTIETLCQQDKYEKNVAQFFLSLCQANPIAYTRYVPRFVAIADRLPNDFHIGSIMKAFVDIVSPTIICKYFGDLPSNSARRLVEYLCSAPRVPAIRRTIEKLCFETKCARAYDDLLFLGLCKADPDSYMRFAGTLVGHMSEGCHFDVQNLRSKFLNTVPQQVMARHVHEAQTFNAESFIVLLKIPAPPQRVTRPSPWATSVEALRSDQTALAETDSEFGKYNILWKWKKEDERYFGFWRSARAI